MLIVVFIGMFFSFDGAKLQLFNDIARGKIGIKKGVICTFTIIKDFKCRQTVFFANFASVN